MNKKMTNIETKRTKREELIYLYTLESAKVNLELASNIDTPLYILKELSKDDFYKDILKDNINFKKYRTLSKDIYFRKLDVTEQEFIIKMFRFIKEKQEIKKEVYEVAIKLNYIPLLEKIASNINTPSSVLEKLAYNESFMIRYKVAKNKKITKEILEILANNNNHLIIRNKVAQNPKSNIETLELLAKDESYLIRELVAANKNINLEIIKKLINDEDLDVRSQLFLNLKILLLEDKKKVKESKEIIEIKEYLASSIDTHLDILELLAKDESYLIRELVAANKNINLEIIKKLINDDKLDVKYQLFTNLRILLLENKNNEKFKEIKKYLASNMNTPPDILEKLAKDEYFSVRSKVAKNLNTTKEILELLTKDKSFFIRNLVAENKNITKEILENLINDEDKIEDLKLKIENQDGKIQILNKDKSLSLNDIKEYAKLIREMKKIVEYNNMEEVYGYFLNIHKENHFEYKEEMAMTTNNINILNELMKDKNPYIRGSIAENPNATEEILRELSKEYGNTMAIIENPNTPIDLLEKYCLDKYDLDVYERAIEKLQERQQDNINNIDKSNDFER